MWKRKHDEINYFLICFVYIHVKWDADVTKTCLFHLSQHVNHIIFSFFLVSLLCLVTDASDNYFANSQGKNVYIELVLSVLGLNSITF